MKQSVLGLDINREVKKMGGEENKILKSVVCAALVTLVLAGFAKANLIDSNSIIQDGIEYYIQTDRSVYDLGEDVEILYRITNLTDGVWQVDGLAPIEDILVELKDGENLTEVWSLSLLYPPFPGPGVLRLQPYESREISVTWPQIDLNGTIETEDDTQVPPGTYRISEVVNGVNHGVEPPVEINTRVAVDITIVPEPGSLILFVVGLPLVNYINRRRRG